MNLSSSIFSESDYAPQLLEEKFTQVLDALREMVILVSDQFVIKYMNKMAVKKLGEICGTACSDHLCNINRAKSNCLTACPIYNSIRRKKTDQTREARIVGLDVEYKSLHFTENKGENITMVIMRDITKQKEEISELDRFHRNLEAILHKKIRDLKESEKISNQLKQEVNVLQSRIKFACSLDGMIGKSKKLNAVREQICQMAPTDSTILITGESGTGKELVANLIYKYSQRNNLPFLKMNCSSINDTLLESEFFGYEKGAFTGATSMKKGKLEVIDGGTIFLDEIGDISPRMQTSLLRFLQNGEIIRVGGAKPITVDVRIIAATNRNLKEAVRKKEFRLDLFYRLNVIDINVPALRERKEDIVELAIHFFRNFRDMFKKDVNFLPNDVIDKLLSYDWPGNVRELENVMHRAMLVAKGTVLTVDNIKFDDLDNVTSNQGYLKNLQNTLGEKSLKETLAMAEKDLIENTLRENKGDISATFKKLKIGKTAFYDKIKRLNISSRV